MLCWWGSPLRARCLTLSSFLRLFSPHRLVLVFVMRTNMIQSPLSIPIDFLKSTTKGTSPTHFQHPGNPDHLCTRGPLSRLGTCCQSDHYHSPLWSLRVGELSWILTINNQSYPGATLNNWVVSGVPSACKHHLGGTLELLDQHHPQTDHDHEVIVHNTEKVLWLYFLTFASAMKR